MKNSSNTYLSFLFAGVLAFGITMSSIHMHLDDFSDVSTSQILVEEELFCAICGSVFKITPDASSAVLNYSKPDSFHFDTDIKSATQPFSRLQQGRSPPLYS